LVPRSGGDDPRYRGNRLWDSDLLLSTLAVLSEKAPLLAAGDFNEARDFDLDESGQRIGTWGREYFQRMSDKPLRAWLHDQWGEERPTHGKLQLDHVVISPAAAGLLDAAQKPHLDPMWRDLSSSSLRGDHVPIWFAINPDWIPD
jgi:endonuclease/exonuclease/phosphatase family metal-dependent hydrolase